MDDSVYFPDMAEKFIAKALAFGGALYKTGNIAELDSGIDCFF